MVMDASDNVTEINAVNRSQGLNSYGASINILVRHSWYIHNHEHHEP